MKRVNENNGMKKKNYPIRKASEQEKEKKLPCNIESKRRLKKKFFKKSYT